MNPTDPARLREGIEKYERTGKVGYDPGLRYQRHAYDDYPALAQAHLELLEAVEEAHEGACGCDCPGRIAYCVAPEIGRAVALAVGSPTETEQ